MVDQTKSIQPQELHERLKSRSVWPIIHYITAVTNLLQNPKSHGWWKWGAENSGWKCSHGKNHNPQRSARQCNPRWKSTYRGHVVKTMSCLPSPSIPQSSAFLCAMFTYHSHSMASKNGGLFYPHWNSLVLSSSMVRFHLAQTSDVGCWKSTNRCCFFSSKSQKISFWILWKSDQNPIKISHEIPIGRCLNLMKIPHFLSHGDPASVVALQQPPTDLDGSAAPAVAELKNSSVLRI